MIFSKLKLNLRLTKTKFLKSLENFLNSKKISLVNGSLKDIQMMVGHSSLQTTQRYIESDSEAQRKVVNLI